MKEKRGPWVAFESEKAGCNSPLNGFDSQRVSWPAGQTDLKLAGQLVAQLEGPNCASGHGESVRR